MRGVDLRPVLTDLRFAGPVAVAWVVAVLLVAQPGSAIVVAAVAAGVAVLSGVVTGHPALRPRVRAVGAVVLTAGACCVLVAVSIAVGQVHRDPEALRRAVGHSATVVVDLRRDLAPGDHSVVGALRAVDGHGVGAVPVRVVTTSDTVLPAGTLLTGRATVERDDPGSPTAAVLFLRGEPEREPPTGALAATAEVRRAFVAVTADLPEPGAALLRGLAIGDRSGLDPGTEAAMETSALTHLTAVSGSNCAVVVALVMTVGRGLGAPRCVRAVAAVALLVAFVVLVRPDPSILRATLMAVVVLVVRLTGRPVRGVPLVALAVLGMLVVDPWTGRAIAFALSVLATGGILVLGPPLTELLARRLWPPVAAAVAVPVAAQAACWPVTIVLAPVFPTYAVPANLLTEPLAPVVTVLGLAACTVAPAWPAAAAVLAGVAWAPAAAIGWVAHTAAALPAASIGWPAGGTGIVAAVVVSGAVAGAVLVRERLRVPVLLVGAVALALGVGAVAVPRAVLRTSVPADWSVAMCDVGQGDAVLVRAPDGPIALVDTGDDEPRLLACLDLLGVDRLALLVLTHFDRDHVGALPAVAGLVDRALVGPVGRAEDARVVEDLRRADVQVGTADDTTEGTLGALGWRVVWPPSGSIEAGNDASVVLATTESAGCGTCVSGVFLGDLGERAQRRLRPHLDVHPDVVKVAHHGSADQDPGLYRQLAAPVGLIGVGADNTYGHPTQRTLDLLRVAGTTAFRADRQGTVVVSRDRSGALRVWTEHPDGASPEPTGGVRAEPSAAGRRIVAGPERTRSRPRRRPRRRPRPGPRRKDRMPAKKPSRAAAAIDQVPWSGIRPAPVVLVTGPEAFLADRAIGVLRDLLVGEDPALEVHDLEADQYAPGLLATLASPSLFGEPRLVRVTNVEKCTDAFITETIAYLQGPADDVTLVLRHGGGVRGKKLLDTIRSGIGGGVEVQCDELKRDTDKIDFVNAEFRAARRKVAPSAVRTLVAAFSDDLAELAAACRQLLADEAEEITDKVVDKYYGGRVETNAFKVADIALAGRSAPAILELRHALATGEAPVPIVAAFASKIRTMAKVSSFRGTSGQAASALGMAPWQVQRAQRDVAGWSEAGLANAITSIAEADTAVKGGSRDAHYALEVMVRTIARRGEAR
ncbi:ComEC/Rec2 family competence protein [Curtobacterium sp. Csp1]|nr:ComEC/Rec2 family competence protein [Curtobacterium sp. csp3]QKS21191.1 ComEC/Rec2 family competence protein [Curtobacterium sp. Csp1]